MIDADDADDFENLLRERLANPFLVLAVAPAAAIAEIERQGQRLLAELAAGLEGARRYATPFGPRERTPELVRSAIAELRDPARRLAHEWWARGLGPSSSVAA
ncbi:MAG TPA: hypothetical protein VN903_19590 [Polyangia bacterium]|jgi:hypothetical protein|nr:hypothetical protein [Polyangia bacterium]